MYLWEFWQDRGNLEARKSLTLHFQKKNFGTLRKKIHLKLSRSKQFPGEDHKASDGLLYSHIYDISRSGVNRNRTSLSSARRSQKVCWRNPFAIGHYHFQCLVMSQFLWRRRGSLWINSFAKALPIRVSYDPRRAMRQLYYGCRLVFWWIMGKCFSIPLSNFSSHFLVPFFLST